MEKRSGLFHRPVSHSLPTTSSNSTKVMTSNAAYTRRHQPLQNGNSIRTLAILATITIFAVVGIFVKLLPSKIDLISSAKQKASSCPHGQERTWHGGHPVEDRPGLCWCGGDEYCMCTPSLAIDIVLYSANESGGFNVWAVRRQDTGQMATIGG